MTLFTHSGQLPHHIDCFADSAFFAKKPDGFKPVRWFGLTSRYGEMWGCTVMLENGAVYRNIPPHAMAFCPDPGHSWTAADAQVWECYGPQFTTLVYGVLDGLECLIKPNFGGRYLFTAVPIGDGFSREPAQSKEFMFCATNHGRLAIRPTDQILFRDKSFTAPATDWPKDLKRQRERWHCE